MQRRVTAELLDDDLGTPEEIAASLDDLRRINRWFGGERTTISLLRRVVAETGLRELSLLELGAGHGDVPLAAKAKLEREGVGVRVTLLDKRSTHLPPDGLNGVAADAMCLPFRDCSFDVVSCSLFAHHFDPNLLKELLIEALRVSRVAVVINDLIRSPVHLLLVYLGLPLFRSRITWNDGPASVRAAYTLEEMKGLLTSLPARKVEVSRHVLYRMGAIVWK